MKTTRPLLGLTLLATMCFGTAASAQVVPTPPQKNDPQITKTTPAKYTAKQKDRVLFLLSGYEYFPKRADLDKIGNAAQIGTILLNIAQDQKVNTVRRIRAIDAMGHYDTNATNAYLSSSLGQSTANIKDKGTLRLVMAQRHHAATSLARGAKDKALPTLKPLLNHKDFQLRLTAISAIGKHCGAKGKATLRAFAKTNKDPVIAKQLRKVGL